MMTEDHEVRMMKEYHDVALRADRLNTFIDENEIFPKLPKREQGLMRAQLAAMVTYMTILECRI